MNSGNTDEVEDTPDTELIYTIVSGMVEQRELFEQRARQWMASPAFDAVYDDLHPGFVIKAIVTLLGKGSVVRMHSAKLRERYRLLAARGQLLYASIIIGNTAIGENNHLSHPAAVLASNEQSTEAVLYAAMLAHTIGEAYLMGGSSSIPKCSKLIADDQYRPLRRRALPAEETGGLPSAMFDIRVSMNDILNDDSPSPFVPLLVDPANQHFAVVPWHVLNGKPAPGPQPVPPPLPSQTAPRTGPPTLPGAPSPGGSAILRHQHVPQDFEPVFGSDHLEIIQSHIEQHLGPISNVFHELVSDRIHLDVHFVPPTPERPYLTLVTSGMSDRPMQVQQGAEDYQYAELMISLPSDWQFGHDGADGETQTDFTDENNFWPVRWLKQLARFPHIYQTWLGPGHTIPNGEPAEPLAEGLPFTGFVIMPPVLAPEAFPLMQTSEGKSINFHAIIPLTTREMDFKLQHGLNALLEQLSAHGVTELVNPHRESVI